MGNIIRKVGDEKTVDGIVYQYMYIQDILPENDLKNLKIFQDNDMPAFWVCVGMNNALQSLIDVTLLDEIEGLPVTILADGSFQGMPLKSIVLGKNIQHVGFQAFKDCDQLKKVILSEELTAIENEAFKGCIRLGNVSLPKKCKELGENVFEDYVNVFLENNPEDEIKYKDMKNYILDSTILYSNFSFYSEYDNFENDIIL